MNTSNPLENMSNQIEQWRNRDSIAKSCSVHAYEIVKVSTEQKHKGIVLNMMKDINRPCRAEDISEMCELDKYQVRRAISKLKKEKEPRIKEKTKVMIEGYWYTHYELKNIS